MVEDDLSRVDRGDIWVVEPAGFPKPRPALVLSINPVNDLCPDVLLVPLASRPGALRVPIEAPGSVTGLELDSHAKCESLGPVHRSRLKRRLGRLPRPVLEEVENGVRRVLGLQPAGDLHIEAPGALELWRARNSAPTRLGAPPFAWHLPAAP